MAGLICVTRYGTLTYMEPGDRLAERHNLRMEALRSFDAATWNREQGNLDMARRQERTGRNLLEDARLTVGR